MVWLAKVSQCRLVLGNRPLPAVDIAGIGRGTAVDIRGIYRQETPEQLVWTPEVDGLIAWAELPVHTGRWGDGQIFAPRVAAIGTPPERGISGRIGSGIRPIEPRKRGDDDLVCIRAIDGDAGLTVPKGIGVG